MSKNKKNESFTLIELLVVIVIVGILAGVITVSISSFVATSQDTKMVAQLSSLGTALETYGTYYQGNLCLEDNNNNSNFISYYGLGTIPSNPNYPSSPTNPAMNGTNDCLLYFSDGQNYSIRTPAPGNKGYLIQESRYMKTQDVQTSCESGWIPFGNRCIMQYEAKCSTKATRASGDGGLQWSACTSQSIISDPAGDPITEIYQDEAKAACQAIGAHLITNAEWMALARDIESVSSNWIGSVGTGVLKRGNVGDTGTGDYDGSNPEYGTGRNELAKLTLSNGEEIWDLSGNVWEWVDETRQTGELPNYSSAWREFNAINYTSNVPYTEVGPKQTYVSPDTPASHGLGRIYTDNNNAYCSSTGTDCSPTHAFRRGGSWDSTSSAGVFTLSLYDSPENRSSSVGFRCAR